MNDPGPARIEELRAQVRYHRERRDLYQAKMYGSRPTTMTKMRELQHEYENARDRLHEAQRARDAAAADPAT